MDILKSKKFKTALVSIVVIIVDNYFPLFDEQNLTAVVAVVVAYLLGQGLADFGKEKKSEISVKPAVEKKGT